MAVRLETLELAHLHEQTLITELLPEFPVRDRARLIKRASSFFAAAISPIEKNHPTARLTAKRLEKIVETLSQRTVELGASNVELRREVAQRRSAEEALRKSERHYAELLVESARLQEQLRRLSRQILSAQEEERKTISRELHDVIAQTLTGINMQLAALKKEALTNTVGLDRNIASTQRLVEQSVEIVHRFARELRPAVLDHLGLVAALHSLLKTFTEQTGVHTGLTAFAGVENLDASRRTVLFRVAQEGFTNIGRHAKATRAGITIDRVEGGICMKIKDDGKSFDVARAMRAVAGKRLGLLGMRERVEMIGGKLTIESPPETGTTLSAFIPLKKPI